MPDLGRTVRERPLVFTVEMAIVTRSGASWCYECSIRRASIASLAFVIIMRLNYEMKA